MLQYEHDRVAPLTCEVLQIFKALHTVYRQSVANPFLRLSAPIDGYNDNAALLAAGSPKW